MRKDQRNVLYGLTLLAFAVGATFEWIDGDSLSGAVRNAIIGLSASLLAATLIAAYVEWTSLGIERYLQEWRDEQPNLREEFRQAKIVDICAVTFWNSLFGEEWFKEAFRERIVARIEGKDQETRILILQPDGIEITRRQKEGRPPEEKPSLIERNRLAVGKLCDVLKEEKVKHTSSFLRYFDYSPGVNWMRVDDKGYLILLAYGKRGVHRGGFSPCLLLQKSRSGGGPTLFDVYNKNFLGMWEQADPSSGVREDSSSGGPQERPACSPAS